MEGLLSRAIAYYEVSFNSRRKRKSNFIKMRSEVKRKISHQPAECLCEAGKCCENVRKMDFVIEEDEEEALDCD